MTNYDGLGRAELIALCARANERVESLEGAIVQAVELIRGDTDALKQVWSLLESALVDDGAPKSVLQVADVEVRDVPRGCHLDGMGHVRTPEGNIDNCALAFGSAEGEMGCQVCHFTCPDRTRFGLPRPVKLSMSSAYGKRAQIGSDLPHQQWHDPEPCAPVAGGRRCGTHWLLPLYPSGRCLEGR